MTMPVEYSLRCYKGQDYYQNLRWKYKKTGAVYPLTGYTAKAQIRAYDNAEKLLQLCEGAVLEVPMRWSEDFGHYLYKKKGESMFIVPNFPHAYLYGECFEAMANSDNVIRLGLTPKFVDKNTFKQLLNLFFEDMIYDPSQSNENEFVCKEGTNVVMYHKEGFDDFCLREIHLHQNENAVLNVKAQSVLFVFKGNVEVTYSHSSTMTLKVEQYESNVNSSL